MIRPFSCAKSYIRGSADYPAVHGEVTFFETAKGIKVKGRIFGLPDNGKGFYGFHLHEGSSCLPTEGDNTFSEAKGHYMQDKPHPLHAGDFPVIMAAKKGCAEFSFLTSRFDINEAIGRTLIIHLDPDDYTTQPSGNSGNRIACGVIKRCK